MFEIIVRTSDYTRFGIHQKKEKKKNYKNRFESVIVICQNLFEFFILL